MLFIQFHYHSQSPRFFLTSNIAWTYFFSWIILFTDVLSFHFHRLIELCKSRQIVMMISWTIRRLKYSNSMSMWLIKGNSHIKYASMLSIMHFISAHDQHMVPQGKNHTYQMRTFWSDEHDNRVNGNIIHSNWMS